MTARARQRRSQAAPHRLPQRLSQQRSPQRSQKNNGGRRPGAASGFTFLELAVCAALVAVLAGVFLSRVLFYQAQAESAGVKQIVGMLRGALQMRAAKQLLAHRDVRQLPVRDENPMDWLSAKPANYLGEFYAPDPKELQKGNWYFDRTDKTLVYLLNNPKTFAPSTSILLKYKVRLLSFSDPPARSGPAAQSPRSSDVAATFVFDQVFDQAAVTGR